MMLKDLTGKQVAVLGFGKEGQAVVQILEEQVPACTIAIADSNEKVAQYKNYQMQLGNGWLQDLDRFDVLIVSPGIPPCKELDAVSGKCTNSTDLFLHEAKAKGALIIGVTGSKGKSTVSSLLAHVLSHCQPKKTYVLGNIGEPSITSLPNITADTIVVLEMSSYQLLRTTTSPHIAVVTSFFADHLDYHSKEKQVRNLPKNEQYNGSLHAYKRAKMRICQFQKEGDLVFYDTFTEGAHDIAAVSGGMTVPTHAADCPVDIQQTKLIGEHNTRNIALVRCVAEQLDCKLECIIEAVQTFTPLPHRLQSVGIYHGAQWIDDAISTTVESAIAAMQALGSRVKVAIFGGQDRGLDFTELGKAIVQSTIKHVVLFPDSGTRIEVAINAANAQNRTITITHSASMQDAVLQCKQAVNALKNTEDITPVVLLSTASPSYNMFKNFEEKGEQFSKYIKILDKAK